MGQFENLEGDAIVDRLDQLNDIAGRRDLTASERFEFEYLEAKERAAIEVVVPEAAPLPIAGEASIECELLRQMDMIFEIAQKIQVAEDINELDGYMHQIKVQGPIIAQLRQVIAQKLKR